MDCLPWFVSVERQHGGIYLVIPDELFALRWAVDAHEDGDFDKLLERSEAQFLKVLVSKDDGLLKHVGLCTRDPQA